jgi:hypothetical protein
MSTEDLPGATGEAHLALAWPSPPEPASSSPPTPEQAGAGVACMPATPRPPPASPRPLSSPRGSLDKPKSFPPRLVVFLFLPLAYSRNPEPRPEHAVRVHAATELNPAQDFVQRAPRGRPRQAASPIWTGSQQSRRPRQFLTAGRLDSDDKFGDLQLRSGFDELFKAFGVRPCFDCFIPWLSSCLPSQVRRNRSSGRRARWSSRAP